MDALGVKGRISDEKKLSEQDSRPAQTAQREYDGNNYPHVGSTCSREEESIVLCVFDQHLKELIGLWRKGVTFPPDHVDLPHKRLI